MGTKPRGYDTWVSVHWAARMARFQFITSSGRTLEMLYTVSLVIGILEWANGVADCLNVGIRHHINGMAIQLQLGSLGTHSYCNE